MKVEVLAPTVLHAGKNYQCGDEIEIDRVSGRACAAEGLVKILDEADAPGPSAPPPVMTVRALHGCIHRGKNHEKDDVFEIDGVSGLACVAEGLVEVVAGNAPPAPAPPETPGE